MPTYLVETYLGRGVAGEPAAREGRARQASQELSRQGAKVTFERSIHVPQDEVCFFVFDAPSQPEAVAAAERAGLDALRVVEARCSELDTIRSGENT